MASTGVFADLRGPDLARLEKRFGSAFYLYRPDRFRDNYTAFIGAFRREYGRSSLAYSFKTNYLPEICHAVKGLGGYAEVVSSMEYDLALKLRIAPEKIIFNGPVKSLSDLEKALGLGSIVNLGNPYEVAAVEELAGRENVRPFQVGLRCNFDIGAPIPSRFGFDVESRDFSSAVHRLSRLGNCELTGLHCHYVPPRRSLDEYGFIASEMLRLAEEVFGDVPPRFIDLGGGFFSPENPVFHGQFEVKIPSPAEYAEAMAGPFEERYGTSAGTGPELILEPGMALVADTMAFVTKVLEVKEVRSRRVALVGGSVYNTLPNKTGRNLPMHCLGSSGMPAAESDGPVDIVGYTCMEDDILYRGFDGFVAAGDYLVFENAGAYSFVLKPPFILPSPPILEWRGDPDSVRVLRRGETFDEVFSSFVFPENREGDRTPNGSSDV